MPYRDGRLSQYDRTNTDSSNLNTVNAGELITADDWNRLVDAVVKTETDGLSDWKSLRALLLLFGSQQPGAVTTSPVPFVYVHTLNVSGPQMSASVTVASGTVVAATQGALSASQIFNTNTVVIPSCIHKPNSPDVNTNPFTYSCYLDLNNNQLVLSVYRMRTNKADHLVLTSGQYIFSVLFLVQP